MPAYPNHQDIRPAYVQPTDPGAVQAGVFWVDTSFPQPFPLKVRNLTNTGWDLIGSLNPIGGPPMPGFEGEEGEEGQPGPPGLRGADGTIGVDGQPGPPGFEGEEGEEGPSGPPGVAGAAGAAGAAGVQGPPGFEGEEGEEGPAGPPGNQGPTGATGATGIQGPPGFEGEEGEEGPSGPPGVTGATGATGATGPAGPPMPGEDGEEAESVFAGPPNQPGGVDTNVQFNNSGFFGGDANFTWDNVNKSFHVGPAVDSQETQILASSNSISNPGIGVSQHNDGAQAATLDFRKSRGTGDSPTQTLTGDVVSLQIHRTYGLSGYVNAARTRVRLLADTGTSATTEELFDIVNAGSLSERLKLSPTGNVVTGGLIQPYEATPFTIPTENFAIYSRRLRLTGSNRVTIQGTGSLRIT